MSIKKDIFAPLASGLGATRRAAMLLLVMMLTTAMAWAQEGETSGTCGDVTWSLTGEPSDYTLTISGTGAMADYNDPAERPWHDNAADISNVVIENGVTRIGFRAFKYCTGLASVTIPASVSTIDSEAFQGCSNLATVTVYAPSCTLGEDAFAYCNKLENIYVFSDLVDDYQGAENWSDYANIITEMLNPHGYCGTTGHETDVIWVLTGESPNYTLTISGTGDMPDYDDPKERPWHDNAEKITNVVIEEGVTSIGAYAFLDFIGLTSVTIPASVESIGASAFDGCSGLESITIPDNVTSIGDNAFSNCRGLTSVTISANVGSIGVGAFRGCSNLETMTVEDGNEVYKSSNNCIIETSTKTLIAGCKNTIIPNDVTIVTIIGDYAFYKCSDLESITIPDNVTSIGFSAFEGCSGLTSIEIPASVTSIGNYAFEGCSDLTSVTVYAQRCSLGTEAFDECNDELKIYVFKDYVDTYKGAENWSAYEDIIKGIKGGYCGTTGHEKDVIWVLTGESLTISGTGKMANYINSEERPWNSDAKDIKTIVIENGVTSIGAYAFYHCFDLTTVTIPASVESIGDDAFEGCSGLTSIEIPTSVTSIGDYAFYGCTGLTSIVIPANVESIGNYAFSNCTGLTSVTVYAQSCSLGTEAFDECNDELNIYVFSHLVSQYQTIWIAYASKIKGIIGGYCGATDETDVIWVLTGEPSDYTLTISGTGAMADLRQSGIYAVNIKNIKTIVIENGVTSICDNAFEGCTGLTSILIPASVKSIGDYAFAECQGLTSIVIPASVKSIGNYAFSGCTGLTSVTVYAPSCRLGDAAFYECNNLTDIYVFSDLVDTYKGAENWSDYADEDIIKGITGGYCGTTGHETDVIWVLTGESLTISGTGKMAAYDEPTERPWDNNAADISNVVIENGVTTIGNYAFFYCQSLTSVTIPASVTSIGDYAFAECQGLTSVTIPASVTSIGNNAFRDCSGLESITIPASVESIGENPFAGCINLATITVEDGNEVYDSPNNNCIIETSTKTLIAGCNNTIIPDDVMSIGNYAFYFCEGLTEVTIPASVTSIGDGAFEGCRNLESTIPASVTSIGVRAFFSCDALTTVTIPASVTSIGEKAFASCINLATMTVDGGNTVYDSRNNCNAIIKKSNNTLIAGCNSSTIPASVESIGEGAFSNCTGLTSIEIPASVTSIGDDAFEGCTGLTSIVIPASVTSIGANAFMYCESLTSVTVYAQSCSLGTEAFDGCNLTNIYVFSDLVDTYKGAENWSDYADIITEMPNPNGKCGDNVRWVLTGESPDYTLTISGTGAMADYNDPAERPWKDYVGGISNVVIENGVMSIGDFAFNSCTGLTSIEIPASVESIGASAFDGCSGLESITIPANVMSIGDHAFQDCSGLTSVTVYAPSCRLGGTSAFDGCASDLNIYVFGKDVAFYKDAENVNWRAYADKISVIFDGTSTETINIPNEVTVKGVTYNRTFTPGKASTVMLPFDYTCNGQEGGTFYKFVGVEKENDNWVATMKATGDDANNQGTLTRNTPYLFMPTATTMTFPNINGSVTLSTDGGGNCVTAEPGSHWTFKGTYEYKEWIADGANADEIGRAYGFAGVAKNDININVGDFVKVASGAKIRPMYCYLLWSDTPNGARSMTRGAAATDEELPSRITVRLVGSNGDTTAIGTLDTMTGEVTFDSEAWYTPDGVRLTGKPTKKGLYINNGKKIVIK